MYEQLVECGVARAVIKYSGGNDEGWVEDPILFDINGDQLDSISGVKKANEILRDFAYEHIPGGWDYDTGGWGRIEVDVVSRKAVFTHNEYQPVEKVFEITD